MNSIKTAAVQMSMSDSREDNLDKAEKLLTKAKKESKLYVNESISRRKEVLPCRDPGVLEAPAAF